MATNDGRWKRIAAKVMAFMGSVPYLIGVALALLGAIPALPAVTGSRWWLVAAVLAIPASLGCRSWRARWLASRPRPASPPEQVPAPPTRTFFFLHAERTNELLSQYEGGMTGDTTERRMELIRRGLVAGIKVGPLGADGSIGDEAVREAARRMTPTRETNFNLLHALLCSRGLLRIIDQRGETSDGRPPAMEQFIEITVDSADLFDKFDKKPSAIVRVSTPRMDVCVKLNDGTQGTADAATYNTQDVKGRVTVMGRVTASHNLQDDRSDVEIRTFAVYR